MLMPIPAAALAITLLGASAYGLSPLEPANSRVMAAETTSGVTVVEKNSMWPLKSYMSMDPCTVTICQEA